MNSMTGFGFVEHVSQKYQISIDIKSDNNRYLDLLVYLPGGTNPLEPKIRERLGEKVKRGRVEVSIRIRELEDDLVVRLNSSAAKQYLQAIGELNLIIGDQSPLKRGEILAFEDLFKQEKNRDLDQLWQEISPLLNKALEEFEHSRAVEGKRTKTDIGEQLRCIEEGLAFVQTKSLEMEQILKESLEHKFLEFLPQIDENRVLGEVAVLLVRYGINEEIVRLESHIREFQTIWDQQGPVGKRLDFLCQEMAREINTIGSKTTLSQVQHKVVGMKDALENLREQLRNVE